MRCLYLPFATVTCSEIVAFSRKQWRKGQGYNGYVYTESFKKNSSFKLCCFRLVLPAFCQEIFIKCVVGEIFESNIIALIF